MGEISSGCLLSRRDSKSVRVCVDSRGLIFALREVSAVPVPQVAAESTTTATTTTYVARMSSDRKAVVKNADMSEEMQQDAVDCATQAIEKFNIEKDIAAYIKKEFDKKYNPTWHCIVGRNFGSYVTHETKHFIYFYLGQVAILLFKSG
ncbi:hypothetical protein Pmani_013631 [Petrolisthes manimaculis]|uniref:Dynein light chain n=1 Tax=Petrolisthes manimaculis TaxID=1843537 RepID=A0AAE1NW72_9EUCA|nr:hypothetical protein Pmani_031339 [Petrolisthes manimaculis]KAK4315116.1 hypothetical protein Pmani_013631 [Petrolisthes manimaculis]